MDADAIGAKSEDVGLDEKRVASGHDCRLLNGA